MSAELPGQDTTRHGEPPYEELRSEGWTRLLTAARRRLERTSGALDGEIGLTAPSEAERRTVIGVTGRYRPETVKRLAVPLAALDAYLYDRYGTGLLQTLGRLNGPLRDRPAERADEDTRREQALTSARSSRLAGEDWFAAWLDRLAADGTLTRLLRRGDASLVDAAVRVLEGLPRDPSRVVPLPVLAEWATGDTKALVPGAPLEQLVLRALVLRAGGRYAGGDVPRDRSGRRALWESAGAIADDLASQVLVLGIRPEGDTVVCDWLRDAADFGIPFRLTLHQLASDPVVLADRDIFVCENPAVLRTAAAELEAESAALVCTEGVPSAACHKLLGDAARAGARLHWRADFDWAGLRITAAAVERHGARPWRMTAADYRDALGQGESTPLAGPAAASPWDPRLAQDMEKSGHAVMEERLLPALLADLTRT
ncbi:MULTISPECIES: TIGR02679 family protein [unclassified Streptomyces]|uniref:TIGR02679 family protein n=1 Tax=unclassified Streptomyces TaxID=2593676 RepID=UPI001F04AB90|nr:MULTISPECIES: TIGR02679 family protein [unclassified Streptomyces]MCH0561820.1 TIGR02679 family protein [Streptomyces sp. MUM 2J]MCH0568867.1 TIGR02679 family protein [Streptomyces sp. MUM 136J]